MGINGKPPIGLRLIYKLIVLSVLIGVAGALFFYESAKENHYAKVVNYSGKVRGGVQRVVKLYLAKDFSKFQIALKGVDEDLKVLKKEIKYISFPILDWGKDYSPKEVEGCWKTLKGLFPTNKTEEIVNLSEVCWNKADRLTDFYEKIVSRNLFLLNTFYAILLGLSILIIFLLIKMVLVDIYHRLEKRANFDPLTGILNRSAFLEAFEYLSASPINYPLGLIVFDLDNFKRVNDTYGHQAGDRVLQEVAKAVRRNIRRTDVFARWGGEEFVLLLPKTDLEGAKKVAEKLRKALEDLVIEPFGIRVTASFGVTEIEPREDLDTAFARADKALYRAKRRGKNRVEVEPPPER